MIHVLFVSSYTGLGGGETVLLGLMGTLDREQFTPHLVCPREGQLPEAARKMGVDVHILPYRGTTIWFIPAIWKRFLISRHLADLIRRLKIGVIHTDYHSLPFVIAASQQTGVPVIWKLHGWWFPIKRWQRSFFRDEINEIVAVTQTVKDRWLAQQNMIPPERVQVFIPGVDTKRFSPDFHTPNIPDKPLVIMIGRFQEVKGHDVFQAMIRLIHSQMPEVRFIVAGENAFGRSKDEAYKRQILDTAKSDPILHECLSYVGFYEDVRPLIAAASVLVCPSRFESFGMVHLESMAMECPVVSMNNGGPAEIMIDGETGYLVPPEDPAALAERVLALLRDPVLRTRMGQAGRARVVEHFTVERYAEKFSQLFKTMYNQGNM